MSQGIRPIMKSMAFQVPVKIRERVRRVALYNDISMAKLCKIWMYRGLVELEDKMEIEIEIGESEENGCI